MIDTIGMTDIGNGRPSNQDAYLLRQKEKDGKLYLLAVVCDGMGGLKKGEIASRYIVEVLKQWFDETLFEGLSEMGIDMIEQNLIDLIRKINQNLLLMSRRMEEVKSMGSTLTLLFVEDHEFFVLNVGDSRTYWFDRDRKFVTTDHTLVELELRAGHLTKEQARKDPRRHILVQCVGVTKDIRVDCYKGRLHPGMEFLLCTDGFYGLLPLSFCRSLRALPLSMCRMALICWMKSRFIQIRKMSVLLPYECMCDRTLMPNGSV